MGTGVGVGLSMVAWHMSFGIQSAESCTKRVSVANQDSMTR